MCQEPPPLPVRVPSNRAMAATLRLWRAGECADLTTLERIAAGLRDLDPAPRREVRTQHEIDGVIARYRAARSKGVSNDD
jgi:hypothetical protein